MPEHDQVPRSPSEAVNGLLYFPRLTDKIRLAALGRLRSDLHDNLGKGMDGWLCGFLRVDYSALKERTLAGGTDEEILAWCESQSRPLSETDKLVWRDYTLKLGWNDRLTPLLERRKRESGLQERIDIVTMAHYIDADEGRA